MFHRDRPPVSLLHRSRILLLLAHSMIGVGLFYIHIYHSSTVFEMRTNFSHLSRMEREMLFTGDQAIYYSAYKTLTEHKDFRTGLNELMNNNATEFPNTINMLKKFHIYPEVAIAYLYKRFMNLTTQLGIHTISCWSVDRGESRDPVISCEGLGEPMYFYLEMVWYIGGFTVFLLYMYGTYLSRHIIGGLTSVIYFFMVHNDATKIHQRPADRENFALPFILWHAFYLTMCIERFSSPVPPGTSIIKRNYFMILKLTALSTVAHLCWPFATIVFTVQMIIMFFLLQFETLSHRFFFDYVSSQVMANTLASFIMFENKNFYYSLNHPMGLSLMIFVLKTKTFRGAVPPITNPPDEPHIQISRAKKLFNDVLLFISLTHIVLLVLSWTSIHKNSEDVNVHFSDIVLAEFSMKPPKFSTILYMCDPDYSFIDLSTMQTFFQVFIMKQIVIMVGKWLKQRREGNPFHDDEIERAKNYLLEDFLEENKISMSDLTKTETEEKIRECFEELKKCNYDYDKYKQVMKKKAFKVADEREAFLSDVKRLKEKISRDNANEEEEEEDTTHKETDSTEEVTKEPPEEPTEEKGSSFAVLSSTKIYIEPFFFYNVLQTFAFLMMTSVILKMKYLLTPFLCLLGATFPPRHWFVRNSYFYWGVYSMLVLSSFADTGFHNIRSQYQAKAQTDVHLESMLQWISTNTARDAVFAGPSDLTSIVMLTTRRSIVNHPNNEYAEMRDRNQQVYSVFSRQHSSEIYSQLVKLKVQYVIVPSKECFQKTNKCKISEIWDYIEPENKNNDMLCAEIFLKSSPSYVKAFVNERYIVLKIFSQVIQLELQKSVLQELTM